MQDRFIYTTDDVLRMLNVLLEGRGGAWWDEFFADRSKRCPYDSGCFHHLPPHRRKDYAELVGSALKPGGSYGLVCFRPEGGSGYTDQQVYERASLGGGLGYSEDRLRALWDTAPFSLRVLRQMKKVNGQGALLW
jgi:hypothetical protein